MKIINTNFEFMKWHKHAIYTSTFIIFVSLISVFTKGLNYGVDFNGGTIIEISFNESAPINDIRNHLKEKNYKKSSVQFFGSEKDILIRMPNIISVNDPPATAILDESFAKVHVCENALKANKYPKKKIRNDLFFKAIKIE